MYYLDSRMTLIYGTIEIIFIPKDSNNIIRTDTAQFLVINSKVASLILGML